MRPLAWIQDAESRLNVAIAVVCLVVAIESVSLVGPILRPRDTGRGRPQTTQTAVPARSAEPGPPALPTTSTRLHPTEATFSVCIAGTASECPPQQIFVRCGGETLTRWAERECGRYTVEGMPLHGAGCQRSAVRVRCMPRP